MKTKCLLSLLVFGVCNAGFSAETLPAFNGVLTFGQEPRFVLVAADGRTSHFLKLGERFAGYTLKSYDAAAADLLLEKGGDTSRIHLTADAAIKKADAGKVSASDREVLESMIEKIPVTGTIVVGGKPFMLVGNARLAPGTKFTATYRGDSYQVELVGVDRTAFTIRYHGIDITRPFKKPSAASVPP
jgi:hypothetical protein